jgi:hypothetical protein
MWLVSLCGPVLAADLVVNRKDYLSMQAAACSRRRCALLTRCPAMGPKAGMTGQPWRQDLPCLPLAYRS